MQFNEYRHTHIHTQIRDIDRAILTMAEVKRRGEQRSEDGRRKERRAERGVNEQPEQNKKPTSTQPHKEDIQSRTAQSARGRCVGVIYPIVAFARPSRKP